MQVKANNTIFQLGDFDGTPEGFMNADKIERAHPSDSTMSPWVPSTFVVGDNINTFPMAIFMRGLNSPVTIQYALLFMFYSILYCLLGLSFIFIFIKV